MNNSKDEQKDATLTDVYNVLKELLKWVKFTGSKEVKSTLDSNMHSNDEKIIYSLSNGVNSSYDIARIMGANDTVRRKISDYWDKWEKAGLGEPVPSQGKGNRFRQSFNLEDFGIELPEIPRRTLEKTEQPQTIVESQTTDQPKTEGATNVG